MYLTLKLIDFISTYCKIIYIRIYKNILKRIKNAGKTIIVGFNKIFTIFCQLLIGFTIPGKHSSGPEARFVKSF